jgi:hypothetical protein
MVCREGHLRHWLAAAKAEAVNSIIILQTSLQIPVGTI